MQQQYDLAIPYQVVHFVSHDEALARQLSSTSGDDEAFSDNVSGSLSDNLDGNLNDSKAVRAAAAVAQETVFISQSEDSLEFTLYLDHDVLQSASVNLSSERIGAACGDTLQAAPDILDHQQLDSLCTVVDGVSHAVCLLWHAHHDRQLRALDLELQAEVDKYTLLLTSCPDSDNRNLLHQRLFDNVRYIPPAGTELFERYRLASESAAVYCSWLVQSFPGPADQLGFRQELARFYRLSGAAKFERIKRLH